MLAGFTRIKASTRRVNRKIADSTRNQRVFFSRYLAANYERSGIPRAFCPPTAASSRSGAGVYIYKYILTYIDIQIPARCPLFSSLDRASDYAHSPIVAPQSPRDCHARSDPHKCTQCPLSPRDVDGTLSALSLSFSLRPM